MMLLCIILLYIYIQTCNYILISIYLNMIYIPGCKVRQLNQGIGGGFLWQRSMAYVVLWSGRRFGGPRVNGFFERRLSLVYKHGKRNHPFFKKKYN